MYMYSKQTTGCSFPKKSWLIDHGPVVRRLDSTESEQLTVPVVSGGLTISLFSGQHNSTVEQLAPCLNSPQFCRHGMFIWITKKKMRRNYVLDTKITRLSMRLIYVGKPNFFLTMNAILSQDRFQQGCVNNTSQIFTIYQAILIYSQC